MKIEHILFTTDLSAESMQPAGSVTELARERKARITLLHVVEELLVPPHGILAPPITHVSDEARMTDARRGLDEARSAFGAGVEITTDVIASDRVAKGVAEYVREKKVDLICLSTHGRTGFRHLALGSVAESILRNAKVPVLVFPQA